MSFVHLSYLLFIEVFNLANILLKSHLTRKWTKSGIVIFLFLEIIHVAMCSRDKKRVEEKGKLQKIDKKYGFSILFEIYFEISLSWEIFNKKNLMNKNKHYTCSLYSRTKFILKVCNVNYVKRWIIQSVRKCFLFRTDWI